MSVLPHPRDLCSLESARRRIGLQPDMVVNDDAIQELITEVSDRIHRKTGREFVARNAVFTTPAEPEFGQITVPEETRIVHADHGSALIVGDLQTFTSAAIAGTVLSTADWIFRGSAPWHRIYLPGQYERGTAIAITGRWGFPQIPASIAGACRTQVRVEYMRAIGMTPETAQEGEPTTQREFAREVFDILDGWRRLGPVLA